MQTMTEFSFALLNPIMPEIFMAVAGLALLVLGVFHGDKAASQIGWLSAIAVVAVAAFLLQSSWERVDILHGMFVMDQFAGISKLLILGGLFISIILSVKFLDEEKMAR